MNELLEDTPHFVTLSEAARMINATEVEVLKLIDAHLIWRIRKAGGIDIFADSLTLYLEGHQVLDEALEIASHGREYVLSECLVLLSRGDYQNCLSRLQLLHMDCHAGAPLLALALTYYGRGEHENSIGTVLYHFGQFLEEEPDAEVAVYQLTGQADESTLLDLETEVGEFFEENQADFMIGTAYALGGHLEKACGFYSRPLSPIMPDNPQIVELVQALAATYAKRAVHNSNN